MFGMLWIKRGLRHEGTRHRYREFTSSATATTAVYARMTGELWPDVVWSLFIHLYSHYTICNVLFTLRNSIHCFSLMYTPFRLDLSIHAYMYLNDACCTDRSIHTYVLNPNVLCHSKCSHRKQTHSEVLDSFTIVLGTAD